jgi:hypothetical protein
MLDLTRRRFLLRATGCGALLVHTVKGWDAVVNGRMRVGLAVP